MKNECQKERKSLTERVSKHIKFPKELVKEIENYQKENHLSSFASAVYELCRKGMQKEK